MINRSVFRWPLITLRAPTWRLVVPVGVVAPVIALTLVTGHATARQPKGWEQQQNPQEQLPTSHELIRRAFDAGQVEEETAYRYHVLAAFEDTRLPAQYRGDDSHMSVLPPEVAEAGARLETFSATTRAELAPFFMRPGDPGSWVGLSTVPGQQPDDTESRRGDVDLDGGTTTREVRVQPLGESIPSDTDLPGTNAAEPLTDESATWYSRVRALSHQGASSRIVWHTVPAAGGKAKVWWQDRYPRDSAIAHGLANELTSVIWPRLTGLMNQEPAPDNGIANNGGDAAFDFYLVHAPGGQGAAATSSPAAAARWAGLTSSSVPASPCHAARYILIDTRGTPLGGTRTYGVLQIATHELMHAITFAYRVRGGCPAPWIGEASGDWASNWLYPLTDGEHQMVHAYLKSVEYRIDNPASPQKYDRFYGEHFLPFFMQQATGGTGFMPRMWSNFRTMDVLEGVDAVLPGGFAKSWPKFLNQLWNQPPVDAPNGFKQWDRFPVGAYPGTGLQILNVTSQFQASKITFLQQNLAQLVFASGVQPIAGHYRHYKFEPSVRAVTFRNTVREEAILHGTVWAIENIGGTWKQPIDLTEEWQKFWCRDTPAENLQELVLIFGNVDWKNGQTVNPQEPPAVEAHAIGCSGWTGTTSQTFVMQDATQSFTVREHVTSTIRFQVDSALITPGLPPEHYRSVGGVLSWNITVTGKCVGGKSGGTAIVPDSVEHFATMSLMLEPDGRRRHAARGHWPDADPRYTVHCPEGPVELAASSIGAFFSSDVTADTVATDGKSFTGQYTERIGPGITKTTRYSFRCQGC